MRLDLDSGEAAFYKIGAATTFIRHGKEVRMVTQKSMPVGVFVGQQVPKVTEQLADGDFVIMVTDGVLEHLHVRDAGETICEVIRGIDTNNAAEIFQTGTGTGAALYRWPCPGRYDGADCRNLEPVANGEKNAKENTNIYGTISYDRKWRSCRGRSVRRSGFCLSSAGVV